MALTQAVAQVSILNVHMYMLDALVQYTHWHLTHVQHTALI
jgi:hypothetical protein